MDCKEEGENVGDVTVSSTEQSDLCAGDDSMHDSIARSRLGHCEVCSANAAKYTCPRCSLHSCSLSCTKIHKEETMCSGQRNKTAYKPLKDFGDMDLLSDYRLLEEVGRSLDTCKRDATRKVTRQGQDLPIHLHKLKAACFRRKIRMWFMPSVMEKHKENTTRLDWKTNVISWRVSWRVPQLNVSFVDERFPEDDLLGSTIESHLSELADSESSEISMKEQIEFLLSGGRTSLRVFMPAEMQYKNSGKYYLLELGKTLRQNLTGKVVIEYPSLILVSKDHSTEYPVVDI